jgi:hypothetical protein
MIMDEETLKKAVNVSVSQHVADAEKNRDAYKKQLELIQTRQLHTAEILNQISRALTDIVERTSKVAVELRAQYYENEIKNLSTGVNKILESQQTSISKLQGAIESIEIQLETYEKLKQDIMTEIGRAKEILTLQESGEIGKARKPGERPQRIKDVRNYSKDSK